MLVGSGTARDVMDNGENDTRRAHTSPRDIEVDRRPPKKGFDRLYSIIQPVFYWPGFGSMYNWFVILNSLKEARVYWKTGRLKLPGVIMRAESFLPWNLEKRIFDAEVKPEWIGKEEDRPEMFWYLNKGRHGKEFMICDPDRELCEKAFDHVRLAASLSVASGKQCARSKLHFDAGEWWDENRIKFKVEETYFIHRLWDYFVTHLLGAVPPEGYAIHEKDIPPMDLSSLFG